MSVEIADLVASCGKCAEFRSNRHEPLLQFERAEFNSAWYLILVDRYSKYVEVEDLPNIRMVTAIDKIKAVLSRHGIPEEIMTDNGSQWEPFYGSQVFSKFKEEYGFKLITRSPNYPQSNGLAKAAVEIAKNIIRKNEDWHQRLLIYRNSPLENGYSTAE